MWNVIPEIAETFKSNYLALNFRFLLTFYLQKGSKGEELINQVCTFLELEEKDFFGLCYSHAKQSDLSCWLQSKKPIYKQIGSKCFTFTFTFTFTSVSGI